MILPKNLSELTKLALDVIDVCNASRGPRATAYRHYAQWIENGQARQSPAGPSNYLALANMLYSHVDRLAAHLFSPSELRFTIDYDNRYEKVMLDRAEVGARLLSREWEANDIDVDFGHSVKESLYYGTSIPKLNPKLDHGWPKLECELVMPWNFGVFNEARNGLDQQEAVCESTWVNRHEVWRHLINARVPNPRALWERIYAHSRQEGSASLPASFMHQVLSTAILDVQGRNPTRPGGIVNLGNMPTYSAMGPSVAIDMFPMYELYVKDDERDDYTTIQIIEPDILITPTAERRMNLFTPGHLPYGLVQPNVVKGYFWGRSEIVDLLQLQDWLTEHLIDVRRLIEMQVEKFIGFEGLDAITDEIYGQMRKPGYVSVPQGAKINDLTPPFPAEMLPTIRTILDLMDRVSGFPPVMSGQGEPGVRAGVHADTLMKTGSPRLRDRSLLVERQCAAFGDVSFAVMREKDGRNYWVNPQDDKDAFLLNDLPSDYRVSIDSHSTSPIYADDHANLVAWGVKSGVLGPEDALEDLPFTHKDIKLERQKERAKQRQQMMQEHPELLEGKQGQRQLRAV